MAIDLALALRMARIAREVYMDFGTARFNDFPHVQPEFLQQERSDTQCVLLSVPENDALYIGFRGSESEQDWKTNFEFNRKLFEIQAIDMAALPMPTQNQMDPHGVRPAQHILPITGDPPPPQRGAHRARMHQGFTEAYITIQDKIHQFTLRNQPKRIYMTGHSLGAALATLCALDFRLTYAHRFEIHCVTFGSPRVGNPDFQRHYTQNQIPTLRFVNGVDAVPGFPARFQGYRHVGQVYRLGNRFRFWGLFEALQTDHYMVS